MTQLYTWASQLPTATWLYSRAKLPEPHCCFRCRCAIENEHHIFVECFWFSDFKRQSLEEVSRMTNSQCKELIEKSTFTSELADKLSHTAKSLFINDSLVWPLCDTMFYLGRLPSILGLVRHLDMKSENTLETRYQAHFFSLLWHISAIQLAGHIWRQIQWSCCKKSNISSSSHL